MTLVPIAHVDADVAVVGSGFAGSLVSLALARRGQRVAMIERGRHPRFAIGESSTPLASLLLEELADRYELPRIRPFSKWGTWQRARPDVAGGVKRGFTFYFHRPGEPFADDREHGRQLLVAASPNDEIADTHWYRPDFDQALAREAETDGAIYLDDTRLDRLDSEGDRAVVEGTRHGRSVRISARFVVDASGPRGFLHRALGLDDPPLRWLPPTQGLYAHFENVARWDRLMPPDETPPYPPDEAALHHVFPGGWIWVLRFNNGITSAGASARPHAGSDGPSWRLGSFCTPIGDSAPSFGRARRWRWRRPTVARATRCSLASTERSNRSTPRAWSIARAATGTRCCPAISSERRRSSKRRWMMSSGCSSAADSSDQEPDTGAQRDRPMIISPVLFMPC